MWIDPIFEPKNSRDLSVMLWTEKQLFRSSAGSDLQLIPLFWFQIVWLFNLECRGEFSIPDKSLLLLHVQFLCRALEARRAAVLPSLATLMCISVSITCQFVSDFKFKTCFILFDCLIWSVEECCPSNDYSFWYRLCNFLHKLTWIVLSVHKLNKLGKFW